MAPKFRLARNPKTKTSMLELGRMTDSQLLAIALASAPTMITVLIGILIGNAAIDDFRRHMEKGFNRIDQRFDQLDRRFELIEGKLRSER